MIAGMRMNIKDIKYIEKGNLKTIPEYQPVVK